MKRISSLFTLVLLLAGFVDIAVGQVEKAPPPPPDSGRAEWLIGRMKALADAGVLFEPDKVAKILSLTLQARAPQTREPSSNCANPYDSSLETTSYIPQEGSWYGATPEGVPHMRRPGISINPPAIMGDPKFSYTISKHRGCTGRAEPKKYTEARIDFSYVSGYACITTQLLNNILPEAKYEFGTDGAEPYDYTGKFDDKSKTKVEFHFFAGTQCLIGISVDQSEISGKRLLRARSQFQQCKQHADHEYCATHVSFGWAEGDKIDAMNDFAIKSCGTLDSYFQKEPLSGKEPEPPPPYGRHPGTPCDEK